MVQDREDHPSLGPRTTRLTDAALRRDEVFVAAISFWEIAMLLAGARLRMELSPMAFRRKVLEQGVREIPLTGAIGVAAAELPAFHDDPADRMIVATALSGRSDGHGRPADPRMERQGSSPRCPTMRSDPASGRGDWCLHRGP